MAEQLSQRKALRVKRALERIRTHLPADAEALRQDLDAQDIIAVNLQRAVQLCVDLGSMAIARQGSDGVPDTMGGVFTRLSEMGVIEAGVAAAMRAAVGFRNLSVHQYEDIDWAIVFTICTQHLDDFPRFLRQLGLGD